MRKTLACASIILVSYLTSHGQSFEYQGLNYTITNASTNECTLTGPVDPAIASLDVPAAAIYYRTDADGHTEQVRCPVTAIGKNAFSNKDQLISVTMADNVRTLGQSAFQGCDMLEEIHLSDNIESIGNSALNNLPMLTKIQLPKELKTIGYSAISANTALREIVFNDKLQTADTYAFSNNAALKSITLPASLQSLGERAFYRCDNLQTVTFLGAVEKIHYFAFDYCDKLHSVYAPDIESWLRNGFTNTTSNPLSKASDLYLGGEKATDIVIPGTFETMPQYAFENSSIESVRLEDGVKIIGERAFRNCTALKSIDLGNTLEIIGPSALAYCTALESLTIPASVHTTHTYILDNCSNLRSLIWKGHIDNIGNYGFGKLDALEEVVIDNLSDWCSQNFPDTDDSNPLKYAKTVTLDGERLTDLVIPDDVTSVGKAIFYGATELRSVVIPDHVKTIGHYAFFGCSGIQHVSIGNSIKSLNLGGIFYGCTATRTLRIEDGTEPLAVTKADWYAEMKNLCNLYIGREITTTGFPTSLRLMEIGKDVTDMGTMGNSSYTNLRHIQSFATEPPVTEAFTENQYDNVHLHVPAGSLEKYRTADVWKNFAHITDNGPIDFTDATVNFSQETYSVPKDSVLLITPDITPVGLTVDDLIFSSSNYSMKATPFDDATIAVTGGSGTLTAAVPYSGSTASTQIEVLPVATKVAFVPSAVTLAVGESMEVDVQLTPANAYPNTYTWTNEEECSPFVTFADNIITGVAEGKCTIRIRVPVSKTRYVSASCKVTVSGYSSITTPDAGNTLETEAEYFNLQGIPVTDPSGGVFIRRQGSTVTKVTIP